MALPMRNTPPDHGIRTPYKALRDFVEALFVKAGMDQTHAALLAAILAQTDRRCVYSHGTRQAPGYIQKIRDGGVNPRPSVTVVQDTPTTAVLDGDGGMGYFPAYRGTEMAIAKAKEHGVGVVTTRNHFHFGAAGTYSRMALPHDCIGLTISSHRYPLKPEDTVLNASGGSPMSIAVPANRQPPLVLDMSARMLPRDMALFGPYHYVFMKSLGLGVVLQALGGILAGIHKPEFQPPQSRWISNQGAFIAVFAVERFMPVDAFKQEMDRFIGEARRMKPVPGMDRAELAGGMEWGWEQENTRLGIPISDEHRTALEDCAHELGVEPPFAAYEATRF